MSGKRFLATLLVICLLVAYFYLISDYLKQSRLQAAFNRQISDASRTMSLIPEPAVNQKERLKEAEQANTAIKESLAPGKVDVTQIVGDIFTLADRYRLKLTPLATEDWSSRKVADNTFEVLPVEIRVEGAFSDLLLFMADIEDKNVFPHLGLTKMTISGTGETAENSRQKMDKYISASITVTLFTLMVVNE